MTNYHVVAQAVLYPQQYRLEYLASDGRTGLLHVLAIDVPNDLAVVAADDLELPTLKLRTEIPAQGERAWSIGFPLDLGLTITEGVANGLVENSIEQRIHYTGAINGGMSGGPALDRRGRVYGVNVSLVTGRQLVGFIVPAKHIPALLARAKEAAGHDFQRAAAPPTRCRAGVCLRGRGAGSPSGHGRHAGGARLRVADADLASRLNAARSTNAAGMCGCAWKPSAAGCRRGCSCRAACIAAGLSMQHRILRSAGLHPLQFERQVNRVAAAP